LPIHNDVIDAYRISVWFLKGCFVHDCCGIEHGYIRDHTFPDQIAVHEAHTIGRGRGHLPNRFLQGQNALLSNIFAKNPWYDMFSQVKNLLDGIFI
jgi:hypothetical protein